MYATPQTHITFGLLALGLSMSADTVASRWRGDQAPKTGRVPHRVGWYPAWYRRGTRRAPKSGMVPMAAAANPTHGACLADGLSTKITRPRVPRRPSAPLPVLQPHRAMQTCTRATSSS